MRFQTASANLLTVAIVLASSMRWPAIRSWRLLLALCGFGLTVASVPGAEILRDSFSYPDGPLVNVSAGKWISFGGLTGQVDVVAGKVILTQTENEDTASPFTVGTQSNGVLYASFVVNFSELPAGAGNFFAAFKDNGPVNFRCRVFASTLGAGPGAFRVGIANTTNATPDNLIPTDLSLNTDYVLVVRYDVDGTVFTNSTLWIDPTSEIDPINQAIATDSPGAPLPLNTFALRQAPGIGGLKFDNLQVGTTFAEVAHSSYNLSVLPGYSLIANQLNNGGNTLDEIMPSPPDGTHFYKYDNSAGTYVTAYYADGIGWQPGEIALNPGEAAFIRARQGFTVTFKGTPQIPVLPLAPCSGYRLLSRQINQPATFDDIVGAPPIDGEFVYLWNTAIGNYDVYEHTAGAGWIPFPPAVPIGGAMWIQLPYGPNCRGDQDVLTPPPAITLQPLSLTVPVGATAVFSVEATGATSYQWRRNGVNIPGETNTSYTLNNVQPTNSGDYSVVLANIGGAIVSQIATLDVSTGDLGFTDSFADRVLITSTVGVGSGSNTNATKEPAEPDHADNPGGKSVWLAWQSPADGIATFSTLGSGFDTLLAVYRGTNLAVLKRSASDDDSAGFYASEVKFNAVAGTTYNVAIDGAYAAGGRIILSWDLERTTDVLPEIVTHPKSRIVPPEGSVDLFVGAGAGSLRVDYQWFFNDQPIPGAAGDSLVLPNVSLPQVGLYRARVSTTPPVVREVFSRPAVVQLAAVLLGDFANVIAQDKFRDTTSLGPDLEFLHNVEGDGLLNAAPVGGFTGTQIFNTYGAAKEPGEPNHCGETGGASYWFAYQSPANGRLSVNTSNSTYDTVLAIYSGPEPVTSFSSLACVACANAAGLGNEVVEFDAAGGKIYYVAVDGVGGVSGTVNLSYDMVTARPVIANQPQHRALALGDNGTLTVAIANTSVTPLSYQWRFNSVNLPAATQSSYTRSNFQPSHQGNYQVVVTNLAGAVTSSVAMMYLGTPPTHATNSFIDGGGFFQSQWLGPTGSLLTIQVSTNLTNWSSVSTSSATAGYINYTDSTPAGLSQRYYRTLLAFP